jgi:hypothetical protein
MKKDLRNREALRRSPELASVASITTFNTLEVTDLRKLAELIRDFCAGTLDRVTIENASAFGGTSRHRFQCVKRALRTLVGEGHPATCAVSAALSNFRAATRRGTRLRDDRTREAIVDGTHWDAFRAIPAIQTIPLNELRAVDRFLLFCAKQGRSCETDDFLAFVADQNSSMLLRILRCGLENLLTSAHPVVMAAEKARSLKEAKRYKRRNPKSAAVVTSRPLEKSVPRDELPSDWLKLFDAILAGKRIRGRKLSRKSVDNMATAARQLVRAARDRGLPDEINLDTVGAYDSALEARGVRAQSRQILFTSLRTMAKRLGLEAELLGDLQDLVGYYEREAKGEVKVKESRLADLPDLQTIFKRANALLDTASETMDRRSRTTLYVDAAALAFLSLIPLRNQDTCLRWGHEIIYIGDDDPADWGIEENYEQASYYLDLRTSKTDSALSGPLAPILTPFLDALILRGQDERLLPDLRRAAMKARGPVFPKSNGEVRSVRSLAERWRVQLGTGTAISRTRIHTLLGALGEHGTRAALALCAQASPRTAKWYQAESLSRRRMLEGQDMIAGLIEMGVEEEGLLARF